MANLHFSILPRVSTGNVTITFPKFGTVSLSEWTYTNVAIETGSTVYLCMGDLYINRTNCITSNHMSVSGSVPYATTIEGLGAFVYFADSIPEENLYYPDPWGTARRCSANPIVNEYTCLYPENNAVYEFHDNGAMVIWATETDSNEESIIVGVLTIIAFAAILPHSRRVSESAEKHGHICLACVVPIETWWQKIICGDFTAIGVWSMIIKVVNSGVLTLVHPSLAVVFDSDFCVVLAFMVYTIISLHATHVLVTVLSGIYQPQFRASYECVFLSVIVFMIPVDVAPQFHAVFQFCLGCTLVFVAGRDIAYAGVAGIVSVFYIFTLIPVAFVFIIPLLVECDAVPAQTELVVALTIVVQVGVLGMTGTV